MRKYTLEIETVDSERVDKIATPAVLARLSQFLEMSMTGDELLFKGSPVKKFSIKENEVK